jgi:FAD:protein FMN transferase
MTDEHYGFVMCRRTTIACGTFVSIEASAPLAVDARALLDEVCAVFAQFESLMHPTREGSDLTALGRAREGTTVHVDTLTFGVLAVCAGWWTRSRGSFDPCTPDRAGRFGDLRLLPPNAVQVLKPVRIDLGGIAKGCAIDRAVDLLRAAGCAQVLVNAGGDVRVFGASGHALELRANGGASGEIVLRDEAIAVSEPRSERSPSEHRGFYSPLDGRAVEGRAVAVRAPLASTADALTKCAMICDPALLQQLLSESAAELITLRR